MLAGFKNNLDEKLRKGILIFLSIEIISLSVSMAVSSIAFGFAVILWIVKLIFEKKWLRTRIDLFFLLYICVEIVSAIFALDKNQAFINMKRIFQFAVFYMTFSSYKSEKEIKNFFIVLFSFVGLLSIIEIILKYIYNIERIGVFQHYMTTGGIKMFICLFIIPFLFQKDLEKKIRIFLIIVFIPVLLTLFLTATRSSWIGFVIGLAVYAILKNKYTLIYLGVIILLFAFFAPEYYKQRIVLSFDPEYEPNKARVNMIVTGWKIYKDYPITGIGDIDVKKTYVQYTVPIEANEGGHLHNNFMQILVTIGSAGFLIYISLFVVLLILLIRNYKYSKIHNFANSLATISIIIFFAFHTNGLFEWNFGDQEISILLWFSMGLSVLAKKITDTKIEKAKI